MTFRIAYTLYVLRKPKNQIGEKTLRAIETNMPDQPRKTRSAMDPAKGEVPPNETEALEPNTLVFENPALAKGFTSVPNYILRDPNISIGAKSAFALLPPQHGS